MKPEETIVKGNCPYCSAALEPENQVCPACGRWIEAADSTLSQQKKAQPSPTAQFNLQTLKLLLLIGAGLALLSCGLLVGVYFWLNQQQERAQVRNATQTVIAAVRTATSQAVAVQAARATQSALATQAVQLTQEARDLQELRQRIAEWDEIIAEDFSSDSGAWFIGDSEDEWARGSWRIEADQYRISLEALDGFSQWMWPDHADIGNDFYMATRLSFIDGPETMDAGVIFRLQESGEFYLFDLQTNGDYSVYLRTPGKWELIIPATPSQAWLPEAPNLLEVIGQADTYLLFLNAIKLTSFQDDRLNDGKVGIQVGLLSPGDEGSWAFDDFILRMP